MILRSTSLRGRVRPRISCWLIAVLSVAGLFAGDAPILEAAKTSTTGSWQMRRAAASTPAEFRALAEYCEQQTKHFQQQKKEHAEMLDLVRRYPVTYGRLPKAPTRELTLRGFLESDEASLEKWSGLAKEFRTRAGSAN